MPPTTQLPSNITLRRDLALRKYAQTIWPTLGRRTGTAPAARRQLSPYSFPHAARGARSTDFMPKFPAGLQDPRYPFEPPPESCDFLGANIVTRAVWANGEAGIGMDFDLRLTRGWYAPCRIELEVPHALSHVPAVVHAVVRDKDVLSQPHNLISTRNERGGTSVRLGMAHCEGTCTGWEDPDIGTLDVDMGRSEEGDPLILMELGKGFVHGSPVISHDPATRALTHPVSPWHRPSGGDA